jgi:hypothetical protein
MNGMHDRDNVPAGHLGKYAQAHLQLPFIQIAEQETVIGSSIWLETVGIDHVEHFVEDMGRRKFLGLLKGVNVYLGRKR